MSNKNTTAGNSSVVLTDSLEGLTTSVAPSLIDTQSSLMSQSSLPHNTATSVSAPQNGGGGSGSLFNPSSLFSGTNLSHEDNLWVIHNLNLLMEDASINQQRATLSQSPPPLPPPGGLSSNIFSNTSSLFTSTTSSATSSRTTIPSTTCQLFGSPQLFGSAISPPPITNYNSNANVSQPSSQARRPLHQVVQPSTSSSSGQAHAFPPYPPTSSSHVGSGRIMAPALPSAQDLLKLSQSPPEQYVTASSSGANTSTSSSSGSIVGSAPPLLAGRGPTAGAIGMSPTSVEERFKCLCQRLESDVNSTIDLLVHGLQMRRNQLLQSLDHIRNIYTNAIYSSANLSSGPSSPPSLPNGFAVGRYAGGLGGLENGQTISHLKIPAITFTKPDAALLKAVTTLGFFNLPAFAANCTASGEGLDRVTAGRSGIFTVATRNCFNEEILVGGMDEILLEVFTYSHSTGQRLKLSSVMVNDSNNGKYTCEYLVPQNLLPGDEVRIVVRVNGLHVPSSPFVITVNDARPPSAWKKILSFGDEGPQMGQFCRPWGVALCKMPLDLCITSSPSNEYMIAVADRSNNRIQLFRIELSTRRESLMRVFGSGPGARAGQLDRPAGISLNPNIGHVVVADKDNHRIQVFDMFGKFLFKFGEKGTRPGQFNYPWDIDCNLNTNELVVSDTRNRRIQVFTAYGHFVCQYTHHIDSPRGVAWVQPGDRIVITDFNKHRMVIFDRKPHQNPAHAAMYQQQHQQAGTSSQGNILTHMQMPPLCSSPAGGSPPSSVSSGSHHQHQSHHHGVKYIGFGEGSGWGELLRPQGIAAADGRIICSDSRNNRVAIWSQSAQTFEYVLDGAADALEARNNSQHQRSGSLLGPSPGGNASANTVAILGNPNQNNQNSNNINSTGVLDRPAGIAACDNLFVIVDFGHNRIHVCIRQPGQQ